MVISTIPSVWSSAVFSAALLLFGVGCIVGSAASGSLADSLGLEAVFLMPAGISPATALVRPRRSPAQAWMES